MLLYFLLCAPWIESTFAEDEMRNTAVCNGKDSGCCTSSNPCDLDDGDCDSDSDCKPGLVCGRDNCSKKSGADWDATDDCCSQPKEEDSCVTEKGACIFPFTYKGHTYNGCTKANHDKAWCVTKEDQTGSWWGNCPSTCQMHISVSEKTYIALTAAQKMERLWSNCLADPTPSDWFSKYRFMSGLLMERMCPTFQTPGDQLPSTLTGHRNKYIHTVGTVGQVEWRSMGDHPYTGVFKGASHGVVRLSLAMKPDTDGMKTRPGMGLKFLRDGVDSANLVAMFSLRGQNSWNFFKNNFSNHIPMIPKGVIVAKFASATRQILQVGLRDWSQYGEDGVETGTPIFPFRLRFEPTGDIEFSDVYKRPFIEDLKSIPKGTTLYRVFALDKPVELGGEEKKIADLVLVSDIVTSNWADKRMFFRHQDMAEDLAINPTWSQYTEKYDGFVLGLSGC